VHGGKDRLAPLSPLDLSSKGLPGKVAGFCTWLRLGRHATRAEKEIWIVAPVIYRDSTEESRSKNLRGFPYVPVFDISQTEGDELPEPCAKLDGQESTGCDQALVNVAISHGFRVEDLSLPTGINGLCSRRKRTGLKGPSTGRNLAVSVVIAVSLRRATDDTCETG